MNLRNLNDIAAIARNSFSNYNKEEIELSDDFQLLFTQIIENNEKQEVSFSKHTTIVHTSKGLTITFPNQWFYIASFFVEYLLSLKEYKNDFNKIFNKVTDQKAVVSKIKKTGQVPLDIQVKIDGYYVLVSDKENFNKFLCNYDWWYGSKTIDRADYFVSPILNLAKVVNASQSYIAELTNLLSENLTLLDFLEQSSISKNQPKQFNEKNEDNVFDVIIEDKKLRNIIYKTFNYVIIKYGEEIILKGYKIKESKIEDRTFKGITIPEYFNSEILIALFNSEQTIDNLKSSNTPRFLHDKFKILDSENSYFTSQWKESSARGLTLNNFNLFLKKISNDSLHIIKENNFFKLIIENKIKFKPDIFYKACQDSGLNYKPELITRYISSLATKPFVLLSGLSGSGKTKLAQAFAQWIAQDETQYCIVPVGADWTNREPLLGYINALDDEAYILPENGALRLLIEADKEQNKNKPYFLILDEMNLSHVERYFADFLSVMESKDILKLHGSQDKKNGVPPHIRWPNNLFIVGTVNIDETTYMFSPKVLDRANVIEFRVNKDDIKSFLDAPKEIDFDNLNGRGSHLGANFISISSKKKFDTIDTRKLNGKLIQFFEELKKTGAEFGYRSASEIHRLYNQLTTLDSEMPEDTKIDIAIMQKLLPKLHGSRRKLSPILEVLASFCAKENTNVIKDFLNNKENIIYDNNVEVLYPLSLEKITRMYKSAIDNGFASYAEA